MYTPGISNRRRDSETDHLYNSGCESGFAWADSPLERCTECVSSGFICSACDEGRNYMSTLEETDASRPNTPNSDSSIVSSDSTDPPTSKSHCTECSLTGVLCPVHRKKGNLTPAQQQTNACHLHTPHSSLFTLSSDFTVFWGKINTKISVAQKDCDECRFTGVLCLIHRGEPYRTPDELQTDPPDPLNSPGSGSSATSAIAATALSTTTALYDDSTGPLSETDHSQPGSPDCLECSHTQTSCQECRKKLSPEEVDNTCTPSKQQTKASGSSSPFSQCTTLSDAGPTGEDTTDFSIGISLTRPGSPVGCTECFLPGVVCQLHGGKDSCPVSEIPRTQPEPQANASGSSTPLSQCTTLCSADSPIDDATESPSDATTESLNSSSPSEETRDGFARPLPRECQCDTCVGVSTPPTPGSNDGVEMGLEEALNDNITSNHYPRYMRGGEGWRRDDHFRSSVDEVDPFQSPVDENDPFRRQTEEIDEIQQQIDSISRQLDSIGRLIQDTTAALFQDGFGTSDSASVISELSLLCPALDLRCFDAEDRDRSYPRFRRTRNQPPPPPANTPRQIVSAPVSSLLGYPIWTRRARRYSVASLLGLGSGSTDNDRIFAEAESPVPRRDQDISVINVSVRSPTQSPNWDIRDVCTPDSMVREMCYRREGGIPTTPMTVPLRQTLICPAYEEQDSDSDDETVDETFEEQALDSEEEEAFLHNSLYNGARNIIPIESRTRRGRGWLCPRPDLPPRRQGDRRPVRSTPPPLAMSLRLRNTVACLWLRGIRNLNLMYLILMWILHPDQTVMHERAMAPGEDIDTMITALESFGIPAESITVEGLQWQDVQAFLAVHNSVAQDRIDEDEERLVTAIRNAVL